jgi:hypothetical protein
MLDVTKRGRYNKIIEIDPKTTFFITEYIDKRVRGTGLDITGWNLLSHGIVRLSYHLSTGKIISIPRYRAYLHLVEVSLSISKGGGLSHKNYHQVYIKGLADNCVYVHKISLRTNPIFNEKIGDVKLYTEPIPVEMVNDWKWSVY